METLTFELISEQILRMKREQWGSIVTDESEEICLKEALGLNQFRVFFDEIACQ